MGVTGDRVLTLASGVEAENDHPLALAIQTAGTVGTATGTLKSSGTGVRGSVDGYCDMGRVGELPAELSKVIATHETKGDTVVGVACDDRVIGVIALATPLRPEVRQRAIARIHDMGPHDGHSGGGDSSAAVESVAESLAIDRVQSGLSPAEKLSALQSMQGNGERVVMVGDGVNDAPALAAAEIGCAVGSGSGGGARQ